MSKLGKRVKRLTRLKVDEISVVDRGAGEGVKVMLMKNAPRFEFNEAFGLVRADGGGDDRRAAKAAKRMETDVEQIDVTKQLDGRLSVIQKTFGCSREFALLKLGESRNEGDRALWQQYKSETVLASSLGEEISVGSALKKMAKRCDALMAADPTIRSRDSAIAKVAMSADPRDRELWANYKAAGQAANSAEMQPEDAPAAGSQTPSEYAFSQLVRAILAANPKMGEAQARDWARRTQQHRPPDVARLVPYRL